MAVQSMSVVKISEQFDRIDKYGLSDDLPAKLSVLSLRTRPMAKPAYSIRLVKETDREHVLDFVRRYFFLDEPMNLAVNLLSSPNDRCQELEDYVRESFDCGVSLIAVDDKGEIIGTLINGLAKKDEPKEEDALECPNPKFRRILQVLQHLDKEACIWEKLSASCNAVIEIRIASTHPAWRGRGLMRALCDEVERLSRQIGVSAIRVDTTSAYSAAAVERLNYRQVYTVPYRSLAYAPQPDLPHTHASVYIKEI